ncbi:MAG TPA: hypothetical protein VJ574_07695 [Candidatus Bathyarchaeia archaeon]|nr:hypothetical protein [Candidatus Bathyarchaeia archaeon]
MKQRIDKSVKDKPKAKGFVQDTGHEDGGPKYVDTPDGEKVYEVPGKEFLFRTG